MMWLLGIWLGLSMMAAALWVILCRAAARDHANLARAGHVLPLRSNASAAAAHRPTMSFPPRRSSRPAWAPNGRLQPIAVPRDAVRRSRE